MISKIRCAIDKIKYTISSTRYTISRIILILKGDLPRKKTFVAFLSLPRSGSTLAAAMFDVHPEISAWFEPYNTRKHMDPDPIGTIDQFIDEYKNIFKINSKYSNIYMIKEVSGTVDSIAWVRECLKELNNNNIDIKVIWLVRDLNHCYLSLINTAKKHWGHPDLDVNPKSFKDFINSSYYSFLQFDDILSSHNSAIMSYEKLLIDPKSTLTKAMKFLELNLHSNQLEYHKHFQKRKSAGDPGLTDKPMPLSINRITQQDEKWQIIKPDLLTTLTEAEMSKYKYMTKISDDIKDEGLIKYNDVTK